MLGPAGRSGKQEGAPPDRIGDVDGVVVYRNVDGFPNVASTCVKGIAGPGGEYAGGATPLVRVPEWDAECAQHPARSQPPPPPTN